MAENRHMSHIVGRRPFINERQKKKERKGEKRGERKRKREEEKEEEERGKGGERGVRLSKMVPNGSTKSIHYEEQ